MSNETELLLNAALKLPAEEREQLAQQIYRSLDEDRPTPAEAQEIERRVQEVRSGRVQTVSGDEAYEQVLQRLRSRGEANGETVLIASVMHTSRDSAYVERRRLG